MRLNKLYFLFSWTMERSSFFNVLLITVKYKLRYSVDMWVFFLVLFGLVLTPGF